VLQPDGTLTITGKCPVTKKEWRLEGIEVDAYNRWRSGTFAQDAFPELTPGQRDLLIHGIVEEEYDRLFKEE
jgi:hypothetical protein